jgi:hypothetical protein
MAGFDNVWEVWAKECGQPPEAGKYKKTNSTQNTEKAGVPLTLLFIILMSDFWQKNSI